MTVGGFSRAMPRILAHEGGKVDDPRDPGGRTNQGITQRTYDAYRQRNEQPRRDVYDMTSGERDAIYKLQYWDAVKADQLPSGLDYVLMDGAVNSGPSRSIIWLQTALGVEADGAIGLITLGAVQNCKDISALIDRICDARMAFLRSLKHWPTYKNGWTTRVAGVRTIGRAWAQQKAVPVTTATSTPKAVPAPESKPSGLWATFKAAIGLS